MRQKEQIRLFSLPVYWGVLIYMSFSDLDVTIHLFFYKNPFFFVQAGDSSIILGKLTQLIFSRI